MSKSESMSILERVEAYTHKHFPEFDSFKAVVGVSGGPDSMALLYIFHKLGIDATVVHCNYRLRGESSDADQRLVEETAGMWNYECVSVSFDPDEREGENFQNWARNRRYRVFRDMKKEYEADAIVTAHHQDDQLETIIQKIMRGAGLASWQGMEIWNGELFRPMLGVTKSEILRYASDQHIPYRLDSSNEESTYARNFLRNGWFPILDDLFPGWRDNLLKIPARANEHQVLSETLADSLLLKRNKIDRKKLLSLDPQVRKPVILHILKNMDEDINVTEGALVNLAKLESIQTGKQLQINDEWSIIRDRENFVLQQESAVRRPKITITRRELTDHDKLDGTLELKLEEWDGKIREELLQLDADTIEWPISIRHWEEGDRFNPLGMDGHQTVADHLTNQKVPSSDKSAVRVLETFDGKICAVIFPSNFKDGRTGSIADWVRCRDKTNVILQIRHKA